MPKNQFEKLTPNKAPETNEDAQDPGTDDDGYDSLSQNEKDELADLAAEGAERDEAFYQEKLKMRDALRNGPIEIVLIDERKLSPRGTPSVNSEAPSCKLELTISPEEMNNDFPLVLVKDSDGRTQKITLALACDLIKSKYLPPSMYNYNYNDDDVGDVEEESYLTEKRDRDEHACYFWIPEIVEEINAEGQVLLGIPNGDNLILRIPNEEDIKNPKTLSVTTSDGKYNNTRLNIMDAFLLSEGYNKLEQDLKKMLQALKEGPIELSSIDDTKPMPRDNDYNYCKVQLVLLPEQDPENIQSVLVKYEDGRTEQVTPGAALDMVSKNAAWGSHGYRTGHGYGRGYGGRMGGFDDGRKY